MLHNDWRRPSWTSAVILKRSEHSNSAHNFKCTFYMLKPCNFLPIRKAKGNSDSLRIEVTKTAGTTWTPVIIFYTLNIIYQSFMTTTRTTWVLCFGFYFSDPWAASSLAGHCGHRKAVPQLLDNWSRQQWAQGMQQMRIHTTRSAL